MTSVGTEAFRTELVQHYGCNTGAATVITCVIKYEIDPYKVDASNEYARRWG